jgi:hypothetical protein
MRLLVLLLALMAGTISGVSARTMRLTIYDDGLSCPGGCDAHVVMHQSDNGTRNAFSPNSTRARPAPCSLNQECRICFDDTDASCMTTRFRGGGPPSGTFDFTPAFYDQHCSRPDVPRALTRQCNALDGSAARSGYTTALSCLASRTDQRCAAVLAAAAAARSADLPKFSRCRELGETRYNAEQTDRRERRSNGCTYSLDRLGGPNRRGVTWKLLKPAACREGTFVGQNGTDCCSADVRFAAHVHPECSRFFLR